MSVGVAVTRVVVFVELGGRGATMRDFAIDTFELNRGVVDTEFLAKDPVYLLQDAPTLRGRDVGDDDVGGTGMGLRSETPYMQVVHVLHSIDGLKRNPDFGQGATARGPFQEDVERFAHDGY